MGIEGYYTYLKKKYPHYFLTEEQYLLDPHYKDVDLFYIDANGMIYESAQHLETCKVENKVYWKGEFEDALLDEVVRRLRKSVDTMKPKYGYKIVFDGMAPMAKRQQQKKRREATKLMNKIYGINENVWDTSNITVGTPFMEKLNARMVAEFGENVSTSEEKGEGEYKIIQEIREMRNTSPHTKTWNIVIEGKDSDLVELGKSVGVEIIRRSEDEYMKIGRMERKEQLEVCGNDYIPRIRGFRLDGREEDIVGRVERYKYGTKEGSRQRRKKEGGISIRKYKEMMEWKERMERGEEIEEKEYEGEEITEEEWNAYTNNMDFQREEEDEYRRCCSLYSRPSRVEIRKIERELEGRYGREVKERLKELL